MAPLSGCRSRFRDARKTEHLSRRRCREAETFRQSRPFVKLEKFNVLPNSDAEHLLRSCCGSSRWVDAMMARRPFASHDMLHHAADESWDGCGKEDWLEAFSHHP